MAYKGLSRTKLKEYKKELKARYIDDRKVHRTSDTFLDWLVRGNHYLNWILQNIQAQVEKPAIIKDATIEDIQKVEKSKVLIKDG